MSRRTCSSPKCLSTSVIRIIGGSRGHRSLRAWRNARANRTAQSSTLSIPIGFRSDNTRLRDHGSAHCGVHILLVEDDDRVAAALRPALHRHGMTTTRLARGRGVDRPPGRRGRRAARPGPARRRRRRRLPGDPRGQRRAGDRRVGARRGRRPHPGPALRRRRLPGQALRHRRAAGPDARGATAAAPRPRLRRPGRRRGGRDVRGRPATPRRSRSRAGRSRSPARSSRSSALLAASRAARCARAAGSSPRCGAAAGRARTGRWTCTSRRCAPSSAARSWWQTVRGRRLPARACPDTGRRRPRSRRARAAAGDRAGRSSASLAVGLGGRSPDRPRRPRQSELLHPAAHRHRLLASLARAADHRGRQPPDLDAPAATATTQVYGVVGARRRPRRAAVRRRRGRTRPRSTRRGASGSTLALAEPALGRRRRCAARGTTRPLVIAEPVLVDGEVRGAASRSSPTDALRERELRGVALIVLAAVPARARAGACSSSLPIVRWILRPVRRLDEGTGRVASAVLAGGAPDPVADGSGPPELRRLSVSFDRMAETVTAALAAQRAFVADASHQLRNPLTALRLRLSNLRRARRRRSRTDDHVRRAGGGRAALHAARRPARAGPHRAHRAARADVDVDAGGRATGSRRGGRSPSTPGCGCAATASTAWRVAAPVGAIETVLDAVLDNAVKFSPSGGSITVHTVAARRPRSSRSPCATPARVCRPDELERATDRFWRSPGHSNVDGSGLGLAIAARTVELAGGELQPLAPARRRPAHRGAAAAAREQVEPPSGRRALPSGGAAIAPRRPAAHRQEHGERRRARRHDTPRAPSVSASGANSGCARSACQISSSTTAEVADRDRPHDPRAHGRRRPSGAPGARPAAAAPGGRAGRRSGRCAGRRPSVLQPTKNRPGPPSGTPTAWPPSRASRNPTAIPTSDTTRPSRIASAIARSRPGSRRNRRAMASVANQTTVMVAPMIENRMLPSAAVGVEVATSRRGPPGRR